MASSLRMSPGRLLPLRRNLRRNRENSSYEESEEEADWEAETESMEVLDDPVRMYLREIGRVRLLTSRDERVLARKLDGGRHLEKLEEEVSEKEGGAPRSWEITVAILRRLVAAEPLLEALGEQLGLPKNLTLSQVTDHPKLRAAIDSGLDLELMAKLAGALGQDLEWVRAKVIEFSLESWLLPPEAIDVLEDATLSQLDRRLKAVRQLR